MSHSKHTRNAGNSAEEEMGNYGTLGQGKFWSVINDKTIKIFWIVVVVIVLGAVLTSYIVNRTRDGLYMVYACNEAGSCYALKSDVTKNWNSATFERFYFNNGGSVELNCTIQSEYRDCYESSDEDSPMHWEIKDILERLGNKRR